AASGGQQLLTGVDLPPGCEVMNTLTPPAGAKCAPHPVFAVLNSGSPDTAPNATATYTIYCGTLTLNPTQGTRQQNVHGTYTYTGTGPGAPTCPSSGTPITFTWNGSAWPAANTVFNANCTATLNSAPPSSASCGSGNQVAATYQGGTAPAAYTLQ